MDTVPKPILETIVSLVSLSDQLALLLTNKLICGVTQPSIDRLRRVVKTLRNWKIRVLPGTSSRTRREIIEASTRICQQYNPGQGPFLPVVLTIRLLEICYRSAPPTRIEAMLMLRIRRALKRSDLTPLQDACFLDGRLDFGLTWEYFRGMNHDIRPQLNMFLNDLFLPQVEYALSTYSVLSEQHRSSNYTGHHELCNVMCGNTV